MGVLQAAAGAGMPCALLLALTCAAAASAARYVDYSGVKMPAYGSGNDYEAPHDAAAAPPSDDYHGHSPDAPASLDYKYEEEPRIKTEKPTKDFDEAEGWRKPARKQRGLIRPVESGIVDVANKYEREDEEVPKFRTSHRYPKHRSRIKGDGLTRDEELPPRRPIKYNRDRKDDVSDIDRKDYFHIDKDDFPDDKSKEFDEDVKFMNDHEVTTRRVNRRKPRDRQREDERPIKRKTDQEIYDDDIEQGDRRIKSEGDKEPDPRRTHSLVGHGRYRPVPDEEDEDGTKVQPLTKPKPKSYDDYDDYYDMKRVNNIKNKLPTLLRRTSARASPPTPTDKLQRLWTFRRKMGEPDDEEPGDITTPDHTATSPPTPPTTVTTTTIAATTSSDITTTSTVNPTRTVIVSTTPMMGDKTSELSLAEKSRLSILKKDQRKQGQHIEPPTKKPPVLLQVTRHMPTVVMVEPPSSKMPWMRAHDIINDSPERIEKVKKLMRRKLVAEAKSIHDLTDNWDEMVCDYVDLSMLDGTASACAHAPAVALLTALACVMCL